MHVTLMHNPEAGEGEPSRESLEAAIRKAGHEVTYFATKGNGYEEALEHPGELVAVAGGDGTVEKIARRLVGRPVPITLLPLGTANNIATTFGIRGSYETLIAGWERGRTTGVDVGLIRTPWDEGVFLESAGLGLFADTIAEADARAADFERRPPGERLAAAFELIGRKVEDQPARRCTVRLDGVTHEGTYVLVEIMNTERIGPSLRLSWGADPCDGWFDVVLAEAGRRDELARYFAAHGPGTDRPAPATIHRAREIEILWSGTRLHVDDAIWPEADADPHLQPSASGETRLSVRIQEAALTFLVPATG